LLILAAHRRGGPSNVVVRIARTPWIGFLVRRLGGLVVILFLLALATFSMVRLIPGDPAVYVAGIDATPAQIAAITDELGLDQPINVQLLTYLRNLLHGNLGRSFATGQPVTQIIQQGIGDSLPLAGSAVLFVMLVSIPGGLLAGGLTRDSRHPRGEVVFAAATSVLGSVPEYLMATFLAFLFAVTIRLFPVAGDVGPQSLVLPVLAIALRPTAVLLRMVRLETLNVLAQDYIRTARSKRLPERLIYLRHALPNVLTAALTVGGILFAGVIGSAVIVETVFARPGIGTSLVSSVLSRDYPVIQGDVLVLGIAVVVVNTVVDILLTMVDPRSLTRKS
jgi:peptide/nickel transport system permease protein